MTKHVKIQVVRRESIDAEKLAAALVELAIHLSKQTDKLPAKTVQEGTSL